MLLFLLFAACSGPDDSGTPRDTRADTATHTGTESGQETGDTGVEPFTPEYWSWDLYTGVQGGLAVPVTYDDEVVPPTLDVHLLDPRFLDDPDPAWMCELRYAVEGTPAVLDPAQVLGWTLSLEPMDTTCTDLDPAVWGDDPFLFALGSTWAMAALPLDPILEKALDEVGVRTDHVIGADTWLDGASVAGANGQQTHYASAVEVDAKMVVDPGDVLDADALLAGTDAWWVLHHAYAFEI
jgi:hypothetical protein